MDTIKGLYQDMADWLTHPFKRDMSIGQLLLIFVLFIIVAFIVFDSLRILKSWMDAAVDTTASTINSAAAQGVG